MNLNSNHTSTQPDYFKHIEYDLVTGAFFLLKLNPSLVTKRQIFPNEDGYLLFYRQGTKFKIKANKVALELGTARLLDDNKVVLHKNLDVNDYRLQNLCAVTRTVYKKVKEAHRNLNGALKLVPHPTDAFSYVVQWKEDNKQMQQVVQDIVVAKRLFTKLQLRFAKLLSKYCVFD
jgi:hypothetical protein